MNISGITNSPNWKALPVGVQAILGTALPRHDILFGVATTRPGEPELHAVIAAKLLQDPVVQETVKDFAVAEWTEKLHNELGEKLMAELTGKLNLALAGVAAAPPASVEVAK